MPAQVEWVNERQWRESMVRVFRQWESRFRENAGDLADLAEREAKTRAPVRTGKLRNGITGSVEEGKDHVTVVLSNDVEYAGFVEFGTRNMRARPHMRPGFAAAEAAYAKTMTEGCE